MVVMNQQYIKLKIRPAIAMIELIFAIVVIGIALLSAPQILNVSIKSSNVAMQQEAVAAVGSEIGLILTRHWDERDSNGTTGYGILRVSAAGDAQLSNGTRDLNPTYTTRKYNDNVGFTDATPTANFGSDIGDNAILDDMDDFDDANHTLLLYASETANLSNNEGEYLDKNIYMTTKVDYAKDSAPTYTNSPVIFNNPFQTSATSTNIKLIKVRLQTTQTAEEHQKDISLSAFACNIGIPPVDVTSMP